MHRNSQFMERLFTLLMAGAYGATLTWMFVSHYFKLTSGQRTLISLVAPWIQMMVLLGGLFLLVLFLILLFTFKRGGDGHHHDHDHAHEDDGHDHNHAHDHHHHDHGHDHHNHAHDHAGCCDHGHGQNDGWNPIRYIPLLVPLILYLMGLPSDQMIRNFEKDLADKHIKSSAVEVGGDEEKAALSPMLLGAMVSPNEVFPATSFVISLAGLIETAVADLDDAGGSEAPFVTDLAVLEKVAQDPALRADFAKKRKVEIDGMFQKEGSAGGASMFQIVRLRMACCLGDASPASVACFTKRPIDERLLTAGPDTKWAKVQGKLRFVRNNKDGKYRPIMKAFRTEWAPFPPFPYLN
jgi:hypothetical protein